MRTKSLFAGALILLCLAARALSATPAIAQAGDVVSIGGTVTEIIYALGQQHRLIGRDTTSTFPAEAQVLPDVGYLHHLSPEGVLSLAPSLILADATAGPKETVELLKATAVKYVEIPQGFSMQDINEKVDIVAQALGVTARGNTLKQEITADFQELAKTRSKARPNPKRVLFVLSASNGNLRVAGTHTPVDAMIALAGGRNAAAGLRGYKTMTNEAVFAGNPDIVLTVTYADGSSPVAADIFTLPALANTPAAQGQALVKVDALALTGFGPRTAQTALKLNRLISDH